MHDNSRLPRLFFRVEWWLIPIGSVYIFTLCPVIYWLDSSELAVSSYLLGVPHSPGHPLYSLIVKLMLFVPIGNIGWRANMASALLGLVALGVISVLLKSRNSSSTLSRSSHILIVSAIGLTFAMWMQCIRAEVYMLQFLLTALVIALYLAFLEREKQPFAKEKYTLAASFAVGISFANHPLLALSLLPFLFTIVITSVRKSKYGSGLLPVSAAVFFFGLSLYLYLPIRAFQDPAVNWGAPFSLQHFYWVVSSQAFQKSFPLDSVFSTFETVERTFFLLMEQVTLPVFFLALAGGWIAFRRSFWKASVFLTALFLNLATLFLQKSLDLGNPDHYGYLLPSILILYLCFGSLINVFDFFRRQLHGETIKRVAGALCIGLVALLPAWNMARNIPEINRRIHYHPLVFGNLLLRCLEPSSVLFTSSFNSIFVLWYLQHGERRREDITIVHRGFLSHPGYGEHLKKRHHRSLDFLMRENEQEIFSQALLGSSDNQIYVEYGLFIPRDVIPYLHPSGVVFKLSDIPVSGTPERNGWQDCRISEREWRNFVRAPQSSRILLWVHYLHGMYYFRTGKPDRAVREWERGLEINPLSRELQERISMARQLPNFPENE